MPTSIQPIIHKADCSPLQGMTVAQIFVDEQVRCMDSIYGLDAFAYQLNLRGTKRLYQLILDVRGVTLGLDVEQRTKGVPDILWTYDVKPIVPTDVRMRGQVIVLACQDLGVALQVVCSIKNVDTNTYTYESNWIQFPNYDQIIGIIPLITGYGSGSDANFSSGAFTISVENDQMGVPVVDFVDPSKPVNQPCYPQAENAVILESSNVAYAKGNIVKNFAWLKGTRKT